MKIPINDTVKSSSIPIEISKGRRLTDIGEGALKPNMGRGTGKIEEVEYESFIPIRSKIPSLKRQEYRKDAEHRKEALSDLL